MVILIVYGVRRTEYGTQRSRISDQDHHQEQLSTRALRILLTHNRGGPLYIDSCALAC